MCSFNQVQLTFYGILIQALVISTCAIPFNALFRYMVTYFKTFSVEIFSHMKLNGYNAEDLDCDEELLRYETIKSKIFLTARITKMLNSMDRVTPEEEAALLTADKSSPWHTQEDANKVDYSLFGDKVGDPLAAAKVVHTYTEPELIRTITVVRKREKDLVDTIKSFENDQQKQVFLLQSFLVESLPGYRRDIVYQFFFADFDRADQASSPLFKVAIAMGIPLYIFALVFYVFLFGVSIGSDATTIWLLGASFAFLQDVFILSTLKIWLKFIVVSTAASKLVREYHLLLKVRTEVLLRRYFGLMKHSNALIHHFNPACRAARSFPELPISRVLISLNDFDLPIIYSEVRATKDYVTYITTAAATVLAVSSFLLTLLPEALQDAIGEVAMTFGFDGGLAAITVVSSVSIALPILIVVTVLSIIGAREWHNYRKWQKIVPAKMYDGGVLNEAVAKSVKTKRGPQNKYFVDLDDHLETKVAQKPAPVEFVDELDDYVHAFEMVKSFREPPGNDGRVVPTMEAIPDTMVDAPIDDIAIEKPQVDDGGFADIMDTRPDSQPVVREKFKITGVSIPLRKRKYIVDESHQSSSLDDEPSPRKFATKPAAIPIRKRVTIKQVVDDK
jgi:hypothetical protein